MNRRPEVRCSSAVALGLPSYSSSLASVVSGVSCLVVPCKKKRNKMLTVYWICWILRLLMSWGKGTQFCTGNRTGDPEH